MKGVLWAMVKAGLGELAVLLFVGFLAGMILGFPWGDGEGIRKVPDGSIADCPAVEVGTYMQITRCPNTRACGICVERRHGSQELVAQFRACRSGETLCAPSCDGCVEVVP